MIDENDAPQGYKAVEDLREKGCENCDIYKKSTKTCTNTDARCFDAQRDDHTFVIFKEIK